MLKIVEGDLLVSDCKIIIHQANCFSRMKSGFAKSLVKMYPVARAADINDTRESQEKFGSYSKAIFGSTIIYNMYSQYNWGTDSRKTDYVKMIDALRLILNDVKQYKDLKIGVPCFIGCGLAGGNWEIVSEILNSVSNEFGEDIYAYKL